MSGAAEVRIAERFQGPPDCANGGWVAGLLAERLAPGPLCVTLRRPVPLESGLRIARADGGGVVLTGADGAVLAEARAGEDPHVGVIPRVSAGDARKAVPDAALLGAHPFPRCFGCGPARDPAEAVALKPGRLRDGVWASAWTPGEGLPRDAGGELASAVTWAALDCPSGYAAVPAGAPPHVLGRLEAHVRASLRVGEEVVVAAWSLGHEGRKRWGATAVLGPQGALIAAARATWIALA